MQREGGALHLACADGAAAPGPLPGAGRQGGLALEVVFEDDHMACVVKPPGVPTDSPPGRSAAQSSSSAGPTAVAGSQGADAGGDMPAGGEIGSPRAPPPVAPSVYSRLPASLAPSRLLGALRRPRHCHRLDEPTGGLLLVGKTRQAQAALCGAFHDRRVGVPVLGARAGWGGGEGARC